MKRSILALGLAMSILVSALPAHAASETSHEKLTDLFAEADFQSSGPCIDTYLSVLSRDSIVRFSRSPVPLSEVFVSLYQFDNCKGATVFSGDGNATLPDTAF